MVYVFFKYQIETYFNMLQELLTNGKEKIHMVQRRKEIIKLKYFEIVEKSR